GDRQRSPCGPDDRVAPATAAKAAATIGGREGDRTWHRATAGAHYSPTALGNHVGDARHPEPSRRRAGRTRPNARERDPANRRPRQRRSIDHSVGGNWSAREHLGRGGRRHFGADAGGANGLGDLEQRVSDAEREQAVVWLRGHVLSGRLTLE